MSRELEIILKSYDYLRQEISNSMNWQNRILTAAGTITPILLSLGLTTTQEALKLSIIVVPPVIIALLASWLIEQTRIMRAGNYLQLLEHEINNDTNGAHILWENWLRSDIYIKGKKEKINIIHYLAQYIGVIGVSYLMSAVAMCIIYHNLEQYNFPMWAWCLCAIFLVFMLVLFILTVRHKEVQKDAFDQWKSEYLEKLKEDIAKSPSKTIRF